jgi:hypothetical protein
MNPGRKKMFGFLFIALIFVAVLGFGWWIYRWQYNRADAILNNWATQNNFRVLEKQKANFGTGPEAVRAGNKQVMYRITVEDQNGQKRSGVAKIGNETTGTLSDEISVDWDQ